MRKVLTSVVFLLFPVVMFCQIEENVFFEKNDTIVFQTPIYSNISNSANAPTAFIEIFPYDTIAPISELMFGQNANPWAGKMNNNQELLTNIDNLKPQIIRWPGGNNSNLYFWDSKEYNGPTDLPPDYEISPINAGMNTTNWAMTLNEYYDLLDKTNSKGCISVNYSYARYGTSVDPVKIAAHYAAEWVRYDKGRTRFWEIGNENYGDWQAGYNIDTSYNQDNQPQKINGELYAQHCLVFIDSMRQAASEIASEIKIGVVGLDKSVEYDKVMREWNERMFPVIKNKADFLSLHDYFTPYEHDSGIGKILSSPTQNGSYYNYIEKQFMYIDSSYFLPVAFTEWNIFATGRQQRTSFINGIHGTLTLCELIKNKCGMAIRWNLGNDWSNGNDYGLFAYNSSEIENYTPYAPFYYLYYLGRNLGEYMVKSKSSNEQVIKIYSTLFANDALGVVIVNTSNQQETAYINIDGQSEYKVMYRYIITGGLNDDSFSADVYINNILVTSNPSSSNYYSNITAFGTNISEGIAVDLPPFSVSHLTFTNDYIPIIDKEIVIEKCMVFPNPSDGTVTIYSPEFEFTDFEIFDITANKVISKKFVSPVSSIMNFDLPFANGIYWIRLGYENKYIYSKIILKR